MVQISKRPPANPRQASRRVRPIDSLLDPGLFKALGDPTRVALLACLAKCRRPCTVGEIAECCAVDFSVVSRHLAILESAGVLGTRRVGRSRLYEVRCSDLSATLRRLASEIDACCPPGGGSCSCGPACSPPSHSTRPSSPRSSR